jgi:hypothetical protein
LTPGPSVAAPSDPTSAGVAVGVEIPSTADTGVDVGRGVAGPEVGAAGDEGVGEDRGVALGAGVGVRAGGGVTAGQVPAGDGGAGSEPVCES